MAFAWMFVPVIVYLIAITSGKCFIDICFSMCRLFICNVITNNVLAMLLSGELHEYCLADTFDGKCASDEIILITSAKYGRMRISNCVEKDFGKNIVHSNKAFNSLQISLV